MANPQRHHPQYATEEIGGKVRGDLDARWLTAEGPLRKTNKIAARFSATRAITSSSSTPCATAAVDHRYACPPEGWGCNAYCSCRSILSIRRVRQRPRSTSHTTGRRRSETSRRSAPSVGFADDLGYIEALANSVRQHWMTHGRPTNSYRLVMSFHGVPRYTLPRERRSLPLRMPKTGRLLADR